VPLDDQRRTGVIVLADAGPISLGQSCPLGKDFPNPFNPSARIRYKLPGSSEVRLTVYDMPGREGPVLVNERRDGD